MLASLFRSRKVWIAVVGVAIAMLRGHLHLTTEELLSIEALLLTLIGGIAAEDHGKGPKTVAAAGDVTINTEEKKP